VRGRSRNLRSRKVYPLIRLRHLLPRKTGEKDSRCNERAQNLWSCRFSCMWRRHSAGIRSRVPLPALFAGRGRHAAKRSAGEGRYLKPQVAQLRPLIRLRHLLPRKTGEKDSRYNGRARRIHFPVCASLTAHRVERRPRDLQLLVRRNHPHGDFPGADAAFVGACRTICIVVKRHAEKTQPIADAFAH